MINNDDAVNELGSWMKQELTANQHKGNWQDFKDINAIISEINYHHQKVVDNLSNLALLDVDKLKENIADTCNCYLFLANATNLIKQKMRNLSDLSDNEIKALSAIHNALYFNDNSDYQTALFEAMSHLMDIKDNDTAYNYPSSDNFQNISNEVEKRGL